MSGSLVDADETTAGCDAAALQDGAGVSDHSGNVQVIGIHAVVVLSVGNSAEHNHGMNADNLYVSTVIANPGPILKRGRIASRRGFVRINKRTTHITIGVSEKA